MAVGFANKPQRNTRAFKSLSGRRTRLEHFERWGQLCRDYLPITLAGTIWRASRETQPEEPTQGWKLHVSAVAPQACDVFEAVVPYLSSLDVRFKAPGLLQDLVELNSGLKHGYSQVGKFITVYPPSRQDSVKLAAKLDELTRGFIAISVPFDNQYRSNSNVFYRYGRFVELQTNGTDGRLRPAVRNNSGVLVYDDNQIAFPDWVSNPFPHWVDESETPTQLATKFRVFEAISQRGKGGTYRAIDVSTSPPRLCVIKQGRCHGEMDWSGQDGFALVKSDWRNIMRLRKAKIDAPQVLDVFECAGNFYLALECIDGPSLHELMISRRRKFSIRQIIDYAIEAARLVERINKAGWIWNDCKPANLIVTESGQFRPVDFENAHPVSGRARFVWTTQDFSSSSVAGDGFALGAMIYLLLTGRLYDSESKIPLRKLRRSVPDGLEGVVSRLLEKQQVSIPATRRKLESIRREYRARIR